MPYETEDEAGWNALPDVSDDQDVPVADSIGPLHTGSEPYSYRLQQYDRTLTIVSQPDKVAHPYAQQTSTSKRDICLLRLSICCNV